MQLALIGTTACGKSDLALEAAKDTGAIILSLDSLSVYKEIDIASAKPTKAQMKGVKHYGIDVIAPNESFNVTIFFDLYKKAAADAKTKGVPLIIVGGTSFYLKALLSGLSDRPLVSDENQKRVVRALRDISNAYENITHIDPVYTENVEKNDIYRMEKWYEIYYETGEIPSLFLKRTRKEPIIKEIPIFEIETDKDILRLRIAARARKMVEIGLVDEVARLEKKYTREPNCMKSIGIKEVIEYFDGLCALSQMEEKIVQNTTKLAKRQRTFNRTQFLQPIIKKPLDEMREEILKFIRNNHKISQ
ncbi:MAG: tRNA (adenosine(37)-N6)-dimethylallyltransferase MiaA [Campylobacteraceae bacterium]|jgi:tRNA dimethylallyltransferase|nr:tRNA (adenosine(37)-N6)-dimethylallyltransferase MiaA [Campylobacteraceae bacterium]